MRTRSTQAGLTLIEILIVLAIIGLLAAILIPGSLSALRRANEANAVTAINTIKAAQAKYVVDHKGCFYYTEPDAAIFVSRDGPANAESDVL